jgi:P-type Ca2+ transporter type 2C
MVTNPWHSMEAARVLEALDTDTRRGLSEDEVRRRQEKYGFNELKKEKRVSTLTVFFNQFKNTLILILLIAVVLSAFVGKVIDAVIIGIIVIFCGVLGFIQEYRAERSLEALKKMLSPMISVLRGGTEKEISTKELVPGDILVLETGDRIPADARLVETHSLKCDEAPLTGESMPVDKDTASLSEVVRVGDRKNMVFAGTMITYGRGIAVVTSTGMNTEFGKIAEEVTTVKIEKTPLEKRMEEIGRWLGIIAIVICFLVAGISIVREAIAGRMNLPYVVTVTMFAIALAVAAVPEALAAVVTGALAIGMRQMAKQNALVRKMPAVETLGCTTVICSDKTGTLTKGEMTVRKIFVSRRLIDVTGSGYTPEGEFGDPGTISITQSESLRKLLICGLLCNDAILERKEGKWTIKGDPTEGALIVASRKAGLHQQEIILENPRIKEIPFSSERKRMTTLHQMKDGERLGFMKGAPERVLERCSYIMEDGKIRDLEEAEKREIFKVNETMAESALRVIGFAFKECSDPAECTEDFIEQDMIFLGLTGMMDPPREEAIEAIKTCKQVLIKPVMITGDHKITALAVAKEMGIHEEGDIVLTGEELENMADEELENMVSQVTVYARVSPMDKLKIVRAWKNKGEIVAMTGDGVNDAPALKHADIGVAMGITGTEVTKEASDMILADDNFATIVTAIERGRWIYDNIKKYLAYLLQCNITEVIVIGGSVLATGPAFLPLLPAAVLYINLVTDGLPALALGISPPEPDVMKRPPRSPKESVFGWDVKSSILRAVLVECPFFFAMFFHQSEDITHARTELFFLFIIIELVISLNCCSLIHSVFKVPPHKWLIFALIWEIVLIFVLIRIPSVRESFGITIPSFRDLFIIALFGVVVFAIIEATKLLLRKKQPAGRKITI